MQTRGTFPALNAGMREQKGRPMPRRKPGQGGFALRRQPSQHATKNPKSLAERRSLSRRLSNTKQPRP